MSLQLLIVVFHWLHALKDFDVKRQTKAAIWMTMAFLGKCEYWIRLGSFYFKLKIWYNIWKNAVEQHRRTTMRKGLGATIMTDQRPPLFSTSAPGSFRGWLLNVAPLLLTAWLPFFSIVTRAILKRESFFTGHTCRSDRFIVFLAPPATSAIRCSVVNNWRRQGEEGRRRRTIFGRWTRGRGTRDWSSKSSKQHLAN